MALTSEEKQAWLARVPLFQGGSPEVIEQLADATAEIGFEPGQLIVQQGQVGNGLCIVVSGAVRIVAGTEVLATLGPGEFFGELSVIDQQPRSASAYAEEPSVCLALASWDLLSVLERDSGLALNMLRELTRRLRQADAQLRH